MDCSDVELPYGRQLIAAGLAHAKRDGIGLVLLKRICQQLGWKLAWESDAEGRTVARLDVGASVPGR